jgi:hypothetical protein
MDQAVRALVELPGGDLVAAGDFGTAGGVPVVRLARWDGSAWSALGSGTNNLTYALTVLPNGNLVVGGRFNSGGGVAANCIVQWDGTTWSALGSGMSSAMGFPEVRALAVLPSGDLVAAGSFTNAGGVPANSIARWDGSSWSALGGGMDQSVLALAVLPNGDLVAGGNFSTAGGVPAVRLARWNGSTWSALGSSLGGLGGAEQARARYATPCVASVVPAGAACASSGGANHYTAVTQPWTGATYHTRGTGLPALAFVAVVYGFAGTAIPLAAVLPPAPAGCTLWASPDLVDITLSLAGTVDAHLALPNTPSLAGLVLHQQLVALEIDASSSFVQNTSTNGLVATVGTF